MSNDNLPGPEKMDLEERFNRPSPVDELPDLEAIADAPTLASLDPVLYLEDLVRGNAQTLNELSKQGVELKDAHSMISTMIQQEFLETILRTIAGEAAVVEAATRVHEQIANTVAAAKSEVTKATLAAPAASSFLNGNRAQRRGR